MSHLNNTRRKNPGMSLSQAMKKASKTYKKKRNQRGGQVKGGEHPPHRKGEQQQGPHKHEDAARLVDLKTASKQILEKADRDHTHPKDKGGPAEHTHPFAMKPSVTKPNKTEGGNEAKGEGKKAESGGNNTEKGGNAPDKEGGNAPEKDPEPFSGWRGGRRRRRKSRRRRRQRGGVNFTAAERAAHGLHGGRRRRRRSRRRRRQRGGQKPDAPPANKDAPAATEEAVAKGDPKTEEEAKDTVVPMHGDESHQQAAEDGGDDGKDAAESMESEATGAAGAEERESIDTTNEKPKAPPEVPEVPEVSQLPAGGGRRRRRSRRRRRNSRRGGRRRRSNRRSNRRRRRRRRSSRRRR